MSVRPCLASLHIPFPSKQVTVSRLECKGSKIHPCPSLILYPLLQSSNRNSPLLDSPACTLCEMCLELDSIISQRYYFSADPSLRILSTI